jgi:Domain of unknown function (DUF1929)
MFKRKIPLLIAFLSVIFLGANALAAPAYIQSATSDPQTPQTTVTVAFPNPQTAGDLDVIVVGWNNTTSSASVADSNHNVFNIAAGPTLGTGISQSIYYAKGIVGGPDVVTITFSGPTAYPDIRIFEYSGATALDGLGVGAAGTGLTAASGNLTANAGDLVFGADIVTQYNKSAGTGFTSRGITNPDGDLSEDQVVAATGTYNATANLGGSASGAWVMQAVAFAGVTPGPTPVPTPPPIASSINFVQGNYADPNSTSLATLTVPFPGAQTAGDLDVVIVGWNGAVSVASGGVKDTAGNAYSLAVGPTSVSGHNSQSIYYAPAIKGGANSVTVNFTGGAAYPDVRILEYSGISATNPVDVTAVSSSTVTANSDLPSFTNTVKTTYAPDLLVAGNTVEGTTTGASDYFTLRFLTKPDSNIAEDRIVTVPGFVSAASDHITGNSSWVMQMVAFRGATPQPADGTPPTVSIAAPSTANGTIDVTTTASDNSGGTGVSYVTLTIDGVPYTSAGYPPFDFIVDTTEFQNGAHTLVATAFDYAGNGAASTPVTVSTSNSNPANPALFGQVSPLAELPIVAVNSALLPDGTVLFYDGEAFGWTAINWDPIKDSVNWVPAPIGTDLFCSGIEQMADGEILVAGGTQMNMAMTNNMDDFGLQSTSKFNVLTQSWTALPAMNFPRWYPTVSILSDGRIIVTSGEQGGTNTDAPISEIYSSTTNTWTALSNAQFPYKLFYPSQFQLPNGKVFVACCDQGPIISQVLDINSQTWTSVGGTSPIDSGVAIQYLPGKFLKTGHSTNPGVTPYTNSIANAYTIDMTASNPQWAQIASMHFPRTYHNMTSLPDGTVLVTGGGPNTNPGDVADATLETELWNPNTGAWTTMSGLNSPRIYHSEAILLPDARVLISGGGRFNNDDPLGIYQWSAEFFSPPYLFKGARPTISGVSTASPALGSAFTVTTPNAASITAVSLIRFGSATHTFNMSQKFIPLAFTAGSGVLTVTAPANSLLAPPGNYMLFILTSTGVPSKAAILHF